MVGSVSELCKGHARRTAWRRHQAEELGERQTLKKDGRSPLFKRILEQWKGKKRDFSEDELQAVTKVLRVTRGANFETIKQEFGRTSTVNLSHRNREMYLNEWEGSPVQKLPAAKLVESKLDLIESNVRNRVLSSAEFRTLRELSKMMKKQLRVILSKRQSPFERLHSVLAIEDNLTKCKTELSNQISKTFVRDGGADEQEDGFLLGAFDHVEEDDIAPNQEANPVYDQLMKVSGAISAAFPAFSQIRGDIQQVDQRTIRKMDLKEVDGDREASFPLVEYLKKGGVTQELFDIVESIVKAGVPDYALKE